MVKHRLIEVLEYKKIPKEAFYKKIGMTPTNFRGKAKDSSLNSNVIEKILSEIPDVNLYWLLTGGGEMLKTEITDISQVTDNAPTSNIDVLVKIVDKLSDSEQRNSKNIEELIAQGREQTENITKLVNFLCQSGIDINDPITDREKRALKSSGSSGQNIATDANNADVV